MVGNRGMFGAQQIDSLREIEGISWVTALKHPQIRKLVESGTLKLSRFKRGSHFELASDSFPGDRLIACRNPLVAQDSAQTRRSLLESTIEELALVVRMVVAGRLKGRDRIGVRVGRVINRFKVAEFIRYEIGDDRLTYWIDREAVASEAALDGIYVIRTAVPASEASAAECVRFYKELANVERAFRAMKTVDLLVRPSRHRLEDRVRAHFFLAMLAYNVEWHMREVLAPLLFDDEDVAEADDPVAREVRSDRAEKKAERKLLADGTAVHSFHTLLQSLATIVRNTCRYPGSPELPAFRLDTIPTAHQLRALHLLEGIEM
jgi:hypothetical protein